MWKKWMTILHGILQPLFKGLLTKRSWLYYVDGSISAQDNGIVSFSNFTNAYDGNAATQAQAGDVTLSVNAGINGSNAPAVGRPIKKVELYVKSSTNLFGPSSFLLTILNSQDVGYSWVLNDNMSGYQEMPEPDGGWTWPHVQGIGLNFVAFGDDSGNLGLPRYSFASLYGGFIRVTT